MKVRRRREIEGAGADELWAIVRDPYHLPRWWPRVERVENVTGDAWTAVLRTERGHSLRADYRLLDRGGRRLSWELLVDGTPFEKIFRSQVTTVAVDGSRVALEVEQQSRRWARLGGIMLRRGTSRLLDDALDNLGELV
jgi:uncharacterized protein YndB with AHSA1/START domain